MTNDLKRELRNAAEREANDNHLTTEERTALVARIRQEDNIDPEDTTEDYAIYEMYVIDGDY